MRRPFHIFALFTLLLPGGCTHTAPLPPAKPRPDVLPPTLGITRDGGARAQEQAGDDPASRYYVNPDFFRMKSDGRTLILDHFRTFQQTTEWSCGPAAALLVLWHFGVTNVSEADLAQALHTHTDSHTPDAPPGSARQFGDYGTSVQHLTEYFAARPDFVVLETSYRPDVTAGDRIAENDPAYPPSERGNVRGRFAPASLYTAENGNPEAKPVANAADSFFVHWLTGHLKAGRPLLVEWADWGGHWQVIIGYDHNGTPELRDDLLILADPYDTTDHWQDGYSIYPLERWFYLWSDTRIASKPFQLQPFLVVEPKTPESSKGFPAASDRPLFH